MNWAEEFAMVLVLEHGLHPCFTHISLPYGPRRNKTCLWGIRQSDTQTSLLSYRD